MVRLSFLTVHCSLTEVCFNDALKTARDLDKYLREHREPIGPLHGMVTTLKDQFNVKGYDTTLGYVGRAFVPAQEDATVVKMLKSLGAVILAKTNLPQSIMWCETVSSFYVQSCTLPPPTSLLFPLFLL